MGLDRFGDRKVWENTFLVVSEIKERNISTYSGVPIMYVGAFPSGTSDTEHSCQSRRLKRHGFDSYIRKIPWRTAWQPTPVFVPGESHGEEPGRLQSMGSQRVGLD